MDSSPVVDKQRAFSPFGFFLVLLGAGLLLSRLQVIPFRWSEVVWMGIAAFGLALVVRAIVVRQRKGVFIGSFLAFFSSVILLRRWDVIDPFPVHWPADLLLILAASFLILYFFDIRRVGILIPVFIFGGLGVLYYLWWMDLMDLYDVRMCIRTYWPVALILLGVGVMLKRGRKKS